MIVAISSYVHCWSSRSISVSRSPSGKRSDGFANTALQHRTPRLGVRLRGLVHELKLRNVVERHRGDALLSSAVALATHDREQPRAGVRITPKRVDVAHGAKDGFLRRILRFAGIARQVVRKRVRRIEVRKHYPFEASFS